MQPRKFDQCNIVLDTPAGVDPSAVQPMHACRVLMDGLPVVVTCWKMTKEELDEVNRTGEVWLEVFSERHPAVYVTGVSPFMAEQQNN